MKQALYQTAYCSNGCTSCSSGKAASLHIKQAARDGPGHHAGDHIL